jgi:hypothetical protein
MSQFAAGEQSVNRGGRDLKPGRHVFHTHDGPPAVPPAPPISAHSGDYRPWSLLELETVRTLLPTVHDS